MISKKQTSERRSARSRSELSHLAEREESLDVVQLLRAVKIELQQVKGGLDDLRAIVTSRRKEHYTVEEIGEIVGRAPYTVRKWITSGRLKAIRVSGTGPRGRLLVPRAELDALIASARGREITELALE